MGVNLQKGQKVDLTKGNTGLSKLLVGLGWDQVTQSNKGFLAGLLGGGKAPEIDCDASVFMLNEAGKFTDKKNLVYFGNLATADGSIKHMGDNLTGEGDGDDEEIVVDLQKIPADIHHLIFVVNIYDARKRGQHFGMIENAFIRLVDMRDNQELMKFNLSEGYNGKTAMIAGEIYRHQGEWKFSAIGEATTDGSLGEMAKRYY